MGDDVILVQCPLTHIKNGYDVTVYFMSGSVEMCMLSSACWKIHACVKKGPGQNAGVHLRDTLCSNVHSQSGTKSVSLKHYGALSKNRIK